MWGRPRDETARGKYVDTRKEPWVLEGTCEEAVEELDRGLVVDGKRYRYYGATVSSIKAYPAFDYKIEEGGNKVCYRATNFHARIVPRIRMFIPEWKPKHDISPECEEEWERFYKQVTEHEKQHEADAYNHAKQASEKFSATVSSRWKSKPPVTKCASNAKKAEKKLFKKIEKDFKREFKQESDTVIADLNKKLDEVAEKFETSNQQPWPPQCEKCRDLPKMVSVSGEDQSKIMYPGGEKATYYDVKYTLTDWETQEQLTTWSEWIRVDGGHTHYGVRYSDYYEVPGTVKTLDDLIAYAREQSGHDHVDGPPAGDGDIGVG